MIKILRKREKLLLELMNWLPFCITQIYRYDGSAGVMNLFWFFCILSSGENCFWFPCFLFITEWLSFDSSGETTSGVTLAHSMVYFIYLWYIVTSSWSWTSRIKGHFLMTHVLQQVFTLLYMKYQWIFSFWTPFLFSWDSFTEQLDFYLLTLESFVIF